MGLSKVYLILDVSNILYRTFFGHIKEDAATSIGMCHHVALNSMMRYYRSYKADDVIMAFDSYSWRKAYTSDLSQCVTHKKYKGTRRQNLSPSEQAKFEQLDEHIEEFAEIMRAHTGIITLRAHYLEADDLVAGFIQNHPDDSHVLISSDKDFIQLLGKNNLTLIDPASDKPRTLKDWNDDPDLFMFEKCFRGDTGDNVMSSYPRLRRTKIEQAMSDEFLRANLMNNTFTVLDNKEDGSIDEITYRTGDVFEENEYLMDLTKQPDVIRKLIDTTIADAIENRGKFSYTKFLQFCGKNDLQRVIDSFDNFVPLLSGRGARRST